MTLHEWKTGGTKVILYIEDVDLNSSENHIPAK